MLSALALCFVQTVPVPPSPIQHLARVELAERGLLPDDLQRLGFDVAYVDRQNRAVDIVATDEEIAALTRLGLAPLVRIEDLTGFYAERARQENPPAAGGGLGSWLTPPFGQGSMGGYWTYDQLVSVLDQIAAAYPAIVRPKSSLGNSIQGRALWMLKVSDSPTVDQNEPEVRMDALHHAREPQGMQCGIYFLLWLVEQYGQDPLATYLVNEREIYFVPCVNPDGYVYNQQIAPSGGGLWRKNRRNNGGGSFGVDLNRNYPYQWGHDETGSSSDKNSELYRGTAPSSEPEVAAMVSLLAARDFGSALSLHTYSGLWLSPWGYDSLYTADHAHFLEIGTLATQVNGYPTGTVWELLYLANGITVDHDYHAWGTFSWTPEIGGDTDGFWPAPSRIVPLADENLLGLQRTALAGGAYIRWLSTSIDDAGDGDGFHEAGESVEFVVRARNSGTRAPSTAVGITLASSSPNVTITKAFHTYGPLAPFTEADDAAAPLAFTIHGGTAAGTSIPFTLTLSHEGYDETLDSAVVTGAPRLLLYDPLEIDVGWTAGVIGDSAPSGRWVGGDPVGTSSGGEPCNPENDATSGAGNVRCFVTGNGGGSAGTDDVDSGHTTLLSPLFDLSTHPDARVGYSRWFADLTIDDDVFQTSISNNGGTSWVPLENVTASDNAWRAVEFRVADYLQPTSTMRLRWIAEDDPNNSLVEGGVDDFLVRTYDDSPQLIVHGRPVHGGPVTWNVSGNPGAAVVVYGTRLPGDAETIFATTGAPSGGHEFRFPLASGVIGANGLFQHTRTLPIHTELIGHTFWFQAEVASVVTPWVTVTIE